MDKLIKIPSVVFHTGRSIPLLGYGTYQLAGKDCLEGTKEALKLGYRHIDTASYYANEAEISKAIAEVGIDRKELYITSKLQPSQQGFDQAIKGCDNILKKLGTNYLDLLLIHWPGTSTYGEKDKRNADLRLETWKAMIKLRSEGKVLDIGVSNFLVHHLGNNIANAEHLIRESGEKPVINQIELHPLLWEGDTISYCQKQGIIVEAYSPLARNDPKLMDAPLMKTLGNKYGKTVAQIAIRWSIQNNFVSIPKSKTKKYIKDNLEVFDFQLTAEEMEQVRALNCDVHTCWNPHSIVY